MLGHCHALLWLPVLLHLAQANSVSYPREKAGGCALKLLQGKASSIDTANSSQKQQVSFIGRWWSEGGAMHASWGTEALLQAAFQVTFQGSSRTVLEHQTGDMVIATGLSTAETHTIWCGRNTEAFYGKTILEAVCERTSSLEKSDQELLVDAGTQFLEPPSLDGQLRVEFIGDSITAGWVVLNSAGSYINQNQTGEDIFQTWDRHLADAWGTADWRAVARTGVGVFPYQAYGIQFHAIQNRFLCSEYSASVCCPLPWDFAVWQADVVVINMGTNDHIPLNPHLEGAARKLGKILLTFCLRRTRNGKGGYEELLTTVRAKYPGALILCLVPLIYTCDRESRYNNMYQGLTDAVRAMEDEKIRLHTTGTREAPWLNCYADYVDGTHPTREGGQKFAEVRRNGPPMRAGREAYHITSQVMSKFRLRSFNFLISSLGIVTQALQKDLIRFGCSLCVCGVFSCGLAAKEYAFLPLECSLAVFISMRIVT
ncbi:hypothetical protein AK812_SmicGene4445 [Symbiodinium microadriaticum]|uniref:SGNH hydrolase-type esterase domain-containing protein n=1 Tax=Symbiodinium microadriaticum TaxID=2951 RepID=A0A1Q9EWH4_SYMMI|nr:hypothetical protein AK812_SmicGene4445 [Symbiodinium microadriaticum]